MPHTPDLAQDIRMTTLLSSSVLSDLAGPRRNRQHPPGLAQVQQLDGSNEPAPRDVPAFVYGSVDSLRDPAVTGARGDGASPLAAHSGLAARLTWLRQRAA